MADERIRVIVEPDVSEFERELESDLRRVDVDYHVDVHADTDPLTAEIRSAKAKVEAVPFRTTVEADTAKATAEAERLRRNFAAPVLKVINASVAPALKTLASFTATAGRPILKTVTLVTTGAIRALRALEGQANRVFAGIAARGRTALGVAAGTLIGAAILGKDELIEADRVSRQTAATLKAQGLAAKFSVGAIEAVAAAQLKRTGIDDQLIQSGQNLLLLNEKFSDLIVKQPSQLKTLTKTAIDFGLSLKSQNPAEGFVVLNKVLADPIKGLAALTRAGVPLSAQFKDRIKDLVETGRVSEATELILAKMEKRAKGLGDAFGESVEARANRATEAIAGIGANILSGLLPVILPLAETIQKAFDSGAVERFFKVFKPIVDGVKIVMLEVEAAFESAGVSGGDNLKAIGTTAKFVGDVLKVIAPIIGEFTRGTITLFRIIKTTFQAVGTVIGLVAFELTKLPGTIFNVVNAGAIGFENFARKVGDVVLRVISWIGMLPVRGGKLLLKLAVLWFRTVNLVRQAVFTVLGRVIAYIAAIPGRIYGYLAGLAGRLHQIATNAFNRFRAAIIARGTAALEWVRGLKDRIVNVFDGAGDWLYKKGKDIIAGLGKGLRDGWEDIADWLSGLKDKIVDLKGPPATDSTLLVDNGQRIMSGLHTGLQERWGPISNWLGGIAPWMKEMVSGADVSNFAAEALAGLKDPNKIDNVFDPLQGLFGGAASGAGIGPAKDKYDVLNQGKLMAHAFGVSVGSWVRSLASNAAAGGATNSQHLTGFAVDFPLGGGSTWQELNRLAGFAMSLVGKAFSQVLWQVKDHFDHVHIGWLNRRAGGRTRAGEPLIVGETGQEGFIPDRPGMILSNSKLNSLLSLGNRVDKIENMLNGRMQTPTPIPGSQRVVNQHNEISIVHPVPDPASVMAAIQARIGSLANLATAGLAP